MESVQRRFTKRLLTLRNTSHNDRLRCLNIPSLELRRLHTDLFWCYKLVFGLAQVSFDDLFVFSHCQVTPGHAFKLFKRQKTNCVRVSFFSVNVLSIAGTFFLTLMTSIPSQGLSVRLNKSILHDFSDFNFCSML